MDIGRSCFKRFLSTPSARRATVSGRLPYAYQCISIHALRKEGDHFGQLALRTEIRFLSTPSARRATSCGSRQGNAHDISIHALREEGDLDEL